MYNEYITQIKNELINIPDGILFEQTYPCIDTPVCSEHLDTLPNGKGKKISWKLLTGITIIFQDYLAEQISCNHKPEKELLEINYCRYGRIGWNMKNGRSIYLGPGDFSLHTRQLCAGSVMTLPSGHYEGLTVCIDLSQFDQAPPELLRGTKITGQMLSEKFCSRGNFSLLTGNEKTEAIFSGFYNLSENLRKQYFILKSLELLLYLSEFKITSGKEPGKYQSEQVEIIRQIHDYLLQNINHRITIEELSKQYLMNPTTLKSVFKAVYGDSLAAHMREHRLEKAAIQLTETNNSISQIAKAVGYTSQSRFSTAFHEVYQMLPLEYRRIHSNIH